MGAGKKIAIGVAIPVIAGIILIFANAAWNEHAEVSYQLQAADWLNPSRHLPLEVTLNEGNSGNIGAGTISRISVINATITQVSVSGVAQYDLSNYCQYNGTVAMISNLTAVKGSSLSKWATIYVAPNEGVPSFQISAFVELSGDWLHPRNSIIRALPTTLTYNHTSTDLYELLK